MKKLTSTKFKRFGPFEYFRTGKGAISAWWAGKENVTWGWEYGPRDSIDRNPCVLIRIGPLVVLGLELFEDGFEAWFMGFWWVK